MSDQFAFLKVEWPEIHQAAAQAAAAAHPDPRTACFHARRALELLVNWAFIVNHLTEQGVMSPSLLYESPFTDLAPTGPDALFDAAQVDRLVAVLSEVEKAALGG